MSLEKIAKTIADTFYELAEYFLDNGETTKAFLSTLHSQAYYTIIEDIRGIRKCKKLRRKIKILPNHYVGELEKSVYQLARRRLDLTQEQSQFSGTDFSEKDLERLKEELKRDLGV